MLANGRELEFAGEAAGDTAAATIGLCYEVRSLVSTNDTVDYSAKIDTLKVRHERFKDAGDQVVTAKIAQTLGLYYHFVATAYTESLNHYLEALETHRSLGDTLEEIADLSSVAAIYLHKQEEPAGDYAAEAYREARESGNLPAIYVAAANMANFLCNRGDFDGALKYIGEATEVSRKLGYEMEETYLCTFMGSVYECMGKNQKAEEYYRRALATKEGTTRYDIVYARIKYGLFLFSQKRYREALDVARGVEALTESFGMGTFQIHLYPLIAECYETLGDYREALRYQRKSMEANSRVLTEQKEREFAILDLRYRVSEEKRINAAQSVALMERNRQLLIIGAIAALLLLAAIFLIVYHRQRVAYLRTIVRHHLENAEAEKRMKERFEKMLAEQPQTARKTASMADDKIAHVFERLERLMTVEKAYRQCDFSLDKAAALLQTNRTYLSQAVNERSGSFSTYVNNYRLQEAIERLSDPDGDESLKSISLSVGFTTPSTFYTLFRQKMGMSPSLFRQNVRNISSEK